MLAKQSKHEKPANGIKNRRGAAVRAASRHGAARPVRVLFLWECCVLRDARGTRPQFSAHVLDGAYGRSAVRARETAARTALRPACNAGGAICAEHRTGSPFYRQEGRPLGGLPASNFAGVCRPQSGLHTPAKKGPPRKAVACARDFCLSAGGMPDSPTSVRRV